MRVVHLLSKRTRFFGPLTPVFGVVYQGRWHPATPGSKTNFSKHAVVGPGPQHRVFAQKLCANVIQAVGNVGYRYVNLLTFREGYVSVNVGLR
jgi:hypothetical protein